MESEDNIFDEHLEDPLTGELLEGTVAEETATYLTMEVKAEETAEKLWMIPFADLMSTLVILFLALFGYAYLGAHTRYESAVLELQKELSSEKNKPDVLKKQKETEVAQAVESYFDKAKLKDVAQVELSAQRIRISLSNPVLFDAGKANLKPEAALPLKAISQLLHEIPNAVLVEGHTDNIPIKAGHFRSNFELSAARAFSVIEFFIKSGLDASRFSTYGYGEFRPVADNGTETGRGKNRRIEINIVRSVSS